MAGTLDASLESCVLLKIRTFCEALRIDPLARSPRNHLYRDWARNHIQRHTRGLDVLSACQDFANTSHQAAGTWLSSWVPDLRNVRKMKVHMFELSNGMQRNVDGMIEYRADPITRWRLFEANHDPNLLVIRGVKVDTIAKSSASV